jgi:hypothetical protein
VRGAADVERLKVPVEQLVKRGACSRVAPLVDLGEQPRPGGLACAAALGPGGMISTSVCRFPDSGSSPPCTRTRSAPLGSLSIDPRSFLRAGRDRVMAGRVADLVSRSVSRAASCDL